MVILNSIEFFDQFNTGATGVNYLLGNVGDDIRCELIFDVKWESLQVSIVADSGEQSFVRQDFSTAGGSWITDGFKAGDDIELANGGGGAANTGFFTIDTVTAETITVIESVTDQSARAYDVFGLTLVHGIDYNFNLVLNNTPNGVDNPVNLTDFETRPKFVADNIAATGTTATMVIQNNSHGWHTESLPTIEPLGLFDTDRTQRWKITHTFKITPLFLPDWIDSFEDNVPPSLIFRDGNSIKYFAKIDAKFDALNPSVPHTSSFDLFKGNVGWYDEFLNGGAPNYSLNSVVFTDDASGNVITEPTFNKKVNAVVLIDSLTDVFSPGVADIILNTIYAPINEDQFANTGTDNYLDNYVFDTIAGQNDVTAGLDGDAFGTARQTITDVTYTSMTTKQVEIRFSFELSAAYQADLLSFDEFNRKGLVFITIQDSNVITTEGLDRNAVVVSLFDYQNDTVDSTLFSIDGQVNFFRYPHSNCGNDSAGQLFSEDGGLAKAIFKTKNSEDAKLINFEARVEVVNDADPDRKFTLDNKVFDLLGFDFCDGIQEIDIQEQRDFILPVGDERNIISIQRVPSLDDGTFAFYEITYGFKVRWETWRTNEDVDEDFCDNENQDWAVFSQTPGWTTQFNIYATMEDSAGNQTTFLHVSEVEMKPYDEEYSTPLSITIETFSEDETTNYDGNIALDENTLVRATIVSDFTAVPTGTPDFYGIVRYDAITVGGINFIDVASTVFPLADDSLWISPTGTTSGAKIVQVDDGKIIIESTIDVGKLDKTVINYKLSARLGAFCDIAGLLQENGADLLQENGFCILLET